MATHSSILAWKIPWTEEPGGLQSRIENYLPCVAEVTNYGSKSSFYFSLNFRFRVDLWCSIQDLETDDWTALQVVTSYNAFSKLFKKLEYNCFTTCVGFCCTTVWISYMYAYIPSCLRIPPTQHLTLPGRPRASDCFLFFMAASH